MPNASLTALCFHMFWFEIEANQDSVFWDQKMLPDVWNRLLLSMLLCSISMSQNCLFKLELWGHRVVFGSITQSCLWLHSSRALLSQCIWPQRSQWLKCCYWCTPMGRPQNARRIKSSRSREATVLSLCYPYGSTIKCNKILFGVTCWGNSALEPSKNGYESNRGIFCFILAISDIPERPSWIWEVRTLRLVCCELRADTEFEIYGSSMGVYN